MNHSKIVSVFFIIGLVPLIFLHSNPQEETAQEIAIKVTSQLDTTKKPHDSLKTVEDHLFNIIIHCYEFADSGIHFLMTDKALPTITCSKCCIRKLYPVEFGCDLVAYSLKKFAEAAYNLEILKQIQAVFDTYLKALEGNSLTAAEDFMSDLAQEIKPYCLRCKEHTDSWKGSKHWKKPANKQA